MQQHKTKLTLSLMSVALVAVLFFSSAAMAADSDGDGLDDSIENMYGWNPYDANSPGEDDYDGDGIIDVTEYYSFTNMYDADDPVDAGDTDDDQDTLEKGLEVYLMGTDPDKADTDCDGVDDNLDANPVDGVCEIPEPNPEADLTDDIRTSGGDSEDQSLAPTVPLQLYYAVEYNDEQTYSTENIDPDSDFMTWSLSDNTFASINENTGIFEFYNGTPEGTVVTVTATHIDNGDITDTMLITSTMGIPDVNGILNDDIRTDIGDSDDQTIAAEVPLQLYYAVDYTDGETYSTKNVASDSDFMTWSLSDYSNASIDADTGVFEFKPGTLAGTQVTVTATGNENSEITDTMVVVQDEPDLCIIGEDEFINLDTKSGPNNLNIYSIDDGENVVVEWEEWKYSTAVTCSSNDGSTRGECQMYVLFSSDPNNHDYNYNLYDDRVVYSKTTPLNTSISNAWNDNYATESKTITKVLFDDSTAKGQQYVCLGYWNPVGTPDFGKVFECVPIPLHQCN